MSNRAPKKQKPNKPREKQLAPIVKTGVWSLPAILSLIIGVVGAVGVIELRPQMLVSPQEAIEKGQPFSVPFRFDNTGYLSFNVADVFCYVKRVKATGFHMEGPVGDLIHLPEWTNVNLDRSDGGTISCNFLRAPDIHTADITIIIDYKPFRSFPFSFFRKYFHFKGMYVDNWQWTKSPSAEIEAEVNSEIHRQVTRLGKK